MFVLHRQVISILILTLIFNHLIVCFPRRTKRAFSYSANDTACIVDHVVYKEGDPVPTDDPCETCHCRPPGFKCALQHCEVKTGCKAIPRDGECCPTYKCGCIHNGTHYEEDERIPDADFLCYTCYCHSSSIYCSAPDCEYRFDCEPEYLLGECCPRYDHCANQKHYSLDWKLRHKLNQTSTTISPITTTQNSNASLIESYLRNNSLVDIKNIATTTMAPTTIDSNTSTTIFSTLFTTTNLKYFDNIETTTELSTISTDEPKINVTNNLNDAENIPETTTIKSTFDLEKIIHDQESKFKNLDSNLFSTLPESTTTISINGSINDYVDEQFTTLDPIRNDQNELTTTTTTTTTEPNTSTINDLHLNISTNKYNDDLTTITSIEITTEVNNE